MSPDEICTALNNDERLARLFAAAVIRTCWASSGRHATATEIEECRAIEAEAEAGSGYGPQAMARWAAQYDAGACEAALPEFVRPRGAWWSACKKCAGTGWKTKVDHDNPGSRARAPCRTCGPSADVRALALAAYQDRGKGGALDPLALWAMADAMEEAGRPAWQECAFCGGDGVIRDGHSQRAWGCRGDSPMPSRWPDHLLAHLRRRPLVCGCGGEYLPLKRDRLPLLSACEKCHREGGFWADVQASRRPHFRGCWAVDVVLGRR